MSAGVHPGAPAGGEPTGASLGVLAAGEREVQRLVLDLHDGPVQDIFAAVSHLQLLARSLADRPADARRVAQASQLLERALGEIRTMIGASRPPGFERRGLGEILEGLVVQHEAMTDEAVELSLGEGLGDCALPTKIALYRIVQEALANGHRHAGATRQSVRATREAGMLVLVVADDGRGFDPQRVLAAERDVGVEGGHYGLRGIQDRVAMLGGRFTLASAPGRGTTLEVRVPADT